MHHDPIIRNFEFYGYNETFLNPYVICFMILMGILVLTLKRQYALVPVIAVVLFITHIQRLVIGGIDISMLRFMIFFGCIRIAKNREHHQIELNSIDKFLIYYVVITIITGVCLERSVSGLINRFGTGCDIMGLYMLTRIFIQTMDDIRIAIRFLILFSVPIAAVMLSEQITGRNFFSFLGGVPEYTIERDGELRSIGAFPHPILAGTFGAFLLPNVVAYWHLTKQKLLFTIGIITSVIITLTSSSSGPIFSYAAGVGGLMMWKFWRYTKIIFWASIGMIVSLHIVMNAPVWHLIGRVGFGGSTGYHRVRLISAAVNHFHEWALFGVRSTAHWGWGLQDITNMFILEGVRGGIVRFLMFITIIMMCFKAIGRVTRGLEKTKIRQKSVWAIGTILFVHSVSFISVAYFGQFVFFLYSTFAIISSVSMMNLVSEPIPNNV